MRRLMRKIIPLLTTAIAVAAISANAAVQTYTENVGGSDSWNNATNWSSAIPSGTDDALISSGATADADNAATPSYSGALTMQSNSFLDVGGTGGSQNAFVGASSITMHDGSTIRWNGNYNLSIPTINLQGDASLVTPFGASDWQTDDLAAITGAHQLTLNGFNGHTFNLNETNTMSSLVLDASDRYNVRFTSAGAGGNGDVDINQRSETSPERSARLYLDVPDTIDDYSTLNLNGPSGGGGWAGDGVDWVVVAGGIDEVVAHVNLYGTSLAPGTYDAGDSATDWLGGSGSITITGIIPEPTTAILAALGMLGLSMRRRGQ